ncbi:hypothetical protein PDIG_49950 [Penicillium digitatum PHI26]|uniref:Uncharacterized protein n=2 Tax=Penicillium digitatum TaxID=36651 RepID=K9FSN0_PEND2|nr:hypothetical protein PDIP_19180 [Penicillium digitatum Pd1]EKV11462.1 hypothetical protein PDIG_49950 [Penicillium digitatum PHI26]EKV20139.1 hypothetical protein PDIP_19180 [Penicillium digitatum Pd1]
MFRKGSGFDSQGNYFWLLFFCLLYFKLPRLFV